MAGFPGRQCSRRGALAAAGLVIAIGLSIAPIVHAKSRPTEALDLELSLRSAALVMAARVDSIEEVPVVYGGKGMQTLHQYVFTPTRVLKGAYSRRQLTLTSADLQIYTGRFDPTAIRAGETRLLILRRSRVGYVNARHGESPDLAFPNLGRDGEALLKSVEAVLALQELNDRLDIVARLSALLPDAENLGAVVLLAALERRAYLAAQHSAAIEAVVGQLASESPLAREAAADVLASLLAADYRRDRAARRLVVAALADSMQRDDTPLAARTSALRAMGKAADAVRADSDAMRLVDFDAPYDTLAELSGRLDVLGRVYEDEGELDALAAFLASLALDAPHDLQRSAALAWARIVGTRGTDVLFDRIRRKQALGLHSVAEIGAFVPIFAEAADPWPLQRALLDFELDTAERVAFVQACQVNPSPKLAPALSGPLDPREPRLRRLTSNLLMEIDTKEAAEALRPHLAEEIDLAYKLRISAFLGRHGIRDGYSYALEHMSEPAHLEDAVQALAAIGNPGSTGQLRGIYENSNDLDWQRAAIRALGLLGDEALREELEALTQELSHPLAPAALIARADLGDASVIRFLPAALSSRSEELAVAGAKAAARLLPLQGEASAGEIRASLRQLASDPQADLAVRRQALEALLVAGDSHFDQVLGAMIRDIRIEQSELLERVRELLRARNVAVL